MLNTEVVVDWVEDIVKEANRSGSSINLNMTLFFSSLFICNYSNVNFIDFLAY